MIARQRRLRDALIILLPAFLVRLVYALQWLRTPYVLSPLVDAEVHEEWALQILSGDWIREQAFYQSPFYPYFLAGFYKLLGHNPVIVVWLQVVVGSLTCLVFWDMARRCFGPRAALIAGLLAALYRPFIFIQPMLLKETWVILGFALMCLFALEVAQGARKEALSVGLAFGWTALSRGNALLLAPVIPFYWWWNSGASRRIGRLTAEYVLGAALAILPAAIHNAIASRDFVLINYAGGFAFFIGNNPDSTGVGTYPVGISSDPRMEERDIRRVAEAESGRRLKPSDISKFWYGKGRQFIMEHPGRWLALTWKKFRVFWGWYEPPDTYDLYFIQKHFTPMLRWPLASFAFVGSLGVLGAALFLRRRGSSILLLLAGAYSASVILFFVSDRYRLPMAVFLIPLAAAAMDHLARASTYVQWRSLWRPCLLALPIVILCWSPRVHPLTLDEVDGRTWSHLVGIYYHQGQYNQALDSLEKAFASDAKAVTAAAISDGALACALLGRTKKMFDLLELGLQMYPTHAMLHNNYGILLFNHGFHEKGIRFLKRAICLSTWHHQLYGKWFIGLQTSG